jgi:hypothetical protein
MRIKPPFILVPLRNCPGHVTLSAYAWRLGYLALGYFDLGARPVQFVPFHPFSMIRSIRTKSS